MYKFFSRAIAADIKDFLCRFNQPFSFDEAFGQFRIDLPLADQTEAVKCIVDVHPTGCLVYMYAPLVIDAQDAHKMAKAAEFLTRMNGNGQYDCFELNYSNGEIRLRRFIDCTDRANRSGSIFDGFIMSHLRFQKCLPGLCGLLLQEMSAEDAAALCERKRSEECSHTPHEIHDDCAPSADSAHASE